MGKALNPPAPWEAGVNPGNAGAFTRPSATIATGGMPAGTPIDDVNRPLHGEPLPAKHSPSTTTGNESGTNPMAPSTESKE